MILKKKENIGFSKLRDDMITIVKLLGYNCYEWEGTNSISVDENPDMDSEKGFVMYVYEEYDPLDKGNFDWIEKDLGQVVNIESISGCEDMILRILYEYFKIYPDDYFYNEMSWYYDKNDIIKIYESSSWDDWCYVKNRKNING